MRTLPTWGAVLLHSLASLAQNNVTVEENDPSLVYTPSLPSWTPNFNPQAGPPDGAPDNNYYHAGGYLAINSEGASISFTFNGSYIAYYSDMFNSHGTMEIEIDNVKTTISTYSSLPYGTPQVKLFEAHVDPDTPDHTIKLTNLENKPMGLDYFLYTVALPMIPVPHSPSSTLVDVSTGTSDPTEPQSTSTSTIAPTKPRNPSLAGTTIVGIIIATAVVAVMLAVGGAMCFRRRRRTVSSAASFSEAAWRPVAPSLSGETTTPYLLAPLPETSVPETPTEKRPRSEAYTAFVRSSIPAPRIGNDSRALNVDAPPSYTDAR